MRVLEAGVEVKAGEAVAFAGEGEGERVLVILTSIADGHLAMEGKRLFSVEWGRPVSE